MELGLSTCSALILRARSVRTGTLADVKNRIRLSWKTKVSGKMQSL
jgi:hypothetical protein